MKIISLRSVNPTLDIDIHPDSTVVMSGRPLFLPEDGGGMKAEGHIAVRISRLGKNISAKFASRYYDAVTVMLRVIPADGVPAGMDGVYSAMDASTVMGEWLDTAMVAIPYSVTLDSVKTDLDPAISEIEDAIHRVSKFMTLKIGDVLMLPAFGVTDELRQSTHINADINGSQVIDVKIV